MNTFSSHLLSPKALIIGLVMYTPRGIREMYQIPWFWQMKRGIRPINGCFRLRLNDMSRTADQELEAHQSRVVKTLITTQVLNGVGVAGTVAAGSLLVASITTVIRKSESEILYGIAKLAMRFKVPGLSFWFLTDES